MPRKYEAPQQDEIMSFLKRWKADPENDGNSPTYQDIADALDTYPANIYRCVLSMVRGKRLRINKKGRIVVPRGRWVPPKQA